MLTARSELDLNTARLTSSIIKVSKHASMKGHTKNRMRVNRNRQLIHLVRVHETCEIMLATVDRLVATDETRIPVVTDATCLEEMVLFAQGFTDAGMKLIWPGET